MIYNRIAIYRIEPHVIRNWSHQTTCAGELNVKKQAKLRCPEVMKMYIWYVRFLQKVLNIDLLN
jgi:hypothetical protein